MKIWKTLSVAIGLMIGTLPAFSGGGGTIKGNILDEFGQPVPMANVFVYEGGKLRGTSSDMNGKFTIKPLIPGRYDLYITCISFDTLIIKDVRVIDDRITMLRDKVMNIKTLKGPEIIAWTIDLIDIDEPGVIAYDHRELEKIPNRVDLTSMVARITPGVYQKEDGDPLQMRGSRAGASTYFIDGVKTNDLNNGLPSASVGNVRVYTGGIPAQYGDVVGGIVVVETKSFMSWYKKGRH